MILPTMTYAEAADAVRRELPMVQAKIDAEIARFRSKVKKTYRFPLMEDREVRSREKTEFHVVLIAHKRSDWKDLNIIIYAVFHHAGLCSACMTRRGDILVFTSHFFDRYRERFCQGEENTTKGFMRMFHVLNHGIATTKDVGDYIREYERYEDKTGGVPQFVGRCAEGNCFGSQDAPSTLVFKTIIPDEMLKAEQIEAFKRLERNRAEIYAFLKHIK